MPSKLDDLIGQQVRATRGDQVIEGTLAGPVSAGPDKGKWRIERPGDSPAVIDPSQWTIDEVPDTSSENWGKPPLG